MNIPTIYHIKAIWILLFVLMAFTSKADSIDVWSLRINHKLVIERSVSLMDLHLGNLADSVPIRIEYRTDNGGQYRPWNLSL